MLDDEMTQWFHQNEPMGAHWLSRHHARPARIVRADDTLGADQALRYMTQGTAVLWQGDYHNARNLLQAVGRRLQKRKRRQAPDASLLERFHDGRQLQAQQATILGRLLLPVGAEYRLLVARAPDIRAAAEAAWGPAQAPGMLPLREVLGLIGAWQWQLRGVPVAALGGDRIHPHYGVFAPTRSEYLDLVARAPLPAQCEVAWDVGTGTGVLAAILARRGVGRILATDMSTTAIACARENLQRLGVANQVQLQQLEGLPADGQADLIVCNPPWLPGKPGRGLDSAIYDPGGAMLRSFLQEAAARLLPNGEAWLIMSDLAERIGLRAANEIPELLQAGGLAVVERHDTPPRHPRSRDRSDPLHAARAAEIISLWRLRAM